MSSGGAATGASPPRWSSSLTAAQWARRDEVYFEAVRERQVLKEQLRDEALAAEKRAAALERAQGEVTMLREVVKQLSLHQQDALEKRDVDRDLRQQQLSLRQAQRERELEDEVSRIRRRLEEKDEQLAQARRLRRARRANRAAAASEGSAELEAKAIEIAAADGTMGMVRKSAMKLLGMVSMSMERMASMTWMIRTMTTTVMMTRRICSMRK